MIWILGAICLLIVISIWGSVFVSHFAEVYGRARDNNLSKLQAVLLAFSDIGKGLLYIGIAIIAITVVSLGINAFLNAF